MSSGAPGNAGGQQQFPQMQAGQQGVPSIGPQQNRPNVPVPLQESLHTQQQQQQQQPTTTTIYLYPRMIPQPMTAFRKQRHFLLQQQMQQGLQQGM